MKKGIKAYLHAGVHVLTLHAGTGELVRSGKFCTWDYATSRSLAEYIRGINDGRLLVIVGVVSLLLCLTKSFSCLLLFHIMIRK